MLLFLALFGTIHFVGLKWNPVPSGGEQIFYVVERQKSGGAWVKANASPTPCTEYLDTQVQPGETYNYRVASWTLAGQESAFSAPVTATVP